MAFETLLKKETLTQKNFRLNELTIKKIDEAIANVTNGTADTSHFVNSAIKFLLDEMSKYKGKNQFNKYQSIRYELSNQFKFSNNRPKSITKGAKLPNNVIDEINKILINLNGINFSDFIRTACEYALADLIKSGEISGFDKNN